VKVAATNKLNAQVTWSEEESVPRQGRGGPSGHGWLKRLSDLTMLPEPARTHSRQRQTLSSRYPNRDGVFYWLPSQPAVISSRFSPWHCPRRVTPRAL